MVSDNLSRDIEPCDYLVEQKDSYNLSIISKRCHNIDPLHEVVYGYNDITVPPCLRRVPGSVINPPLGEGANCDNRKHGSGMCPHLLKEDLTKVALLDRFDAIFD